MRFMYLTDRERTLCKKVRKHEDWGTLSAKEIHRLCAAFCWEIYEKWEGSNLDWVPLTYEKPLPIMRFSTVDV
jgi:hypothetical protein